MGNYCHIVDGKLAYAGHLPKDGGLPNYSLEDLIATDMDIQSDKVVFTDNIVAFTDEEMKQNKWNDWTSGLFVSDDNNTIGINRVLEDVIDSLVRKYPDILNDSENVRLKQRHKAKKDLRAAKPTNPNE